MSVLLVSFSAPTAKDARGGKGEQQQVFVFDGKSEVCAQRNGEVRPRERRENKSDLEEEEEEEEEKDEDEELDEEDFSSDGMIKALKKNNNNNDDDEDYVLTHHRALLPRPRFLIGGASRRAIGGFEFE